MGEDCLRHTFVVCAYGESPYLEECILSLLGQNIKSRILLATSTPNGLIRDMAQRYGLPLHINPGPGGIAQDWNFAYAKADTEYITLAHQDDVYGPRYTARMLERMAKAKRPLLFFSNYYELRGGKRVEANKLLRIKRLLTAPLRLRPLASFVPVKRFCLALGNGICCPSVTFAARNLPGEIFAPHFFSNVDWQAWERLSLKPGSFCYDPQMLMGHRIHEASETSRVIGESRRTAEDLEMFQKFWPRPIARLLARGYASSEKSNKG